MNPFSFAKPTAPSTPPGRGWICQKSRPLSSLPPIPQSPVAFLPILCYPKDQTPQLSGVSRLVQIDLHVVLWVVDGDSGSPMMALKGR